jgi:phosphosulfolactate synthase (CoM biosynthesis protein A)
MLSLYELLSGNTFLNSNKKNHILKGQKFSKSIFYAASSPKVNPKFVPKIDPDCNLGSIFCSFLKDSDFIKVKEIS